MPVRSAVLDLLRVIAVALALGASPGAARAVTIRISCGAVGQELDLCRGAAQDWATNTGNTVEVVPTPNDASARLALYEQVLSSGSDHIDVFQIDVVWPGLLGAHLLDLRPYTHGAERALLPSFVAADTRDGRLVAMPWFVNAGLLFYRKDLLAKYGVPVPETWAELASSARRIQDAERQAGNPRLWGYVWQGRAYEGLTTNALEWLVSNGAGEVVDPGGRITVDNPRAVAALRMAAGWVGTISPVAVLNYAEEESRGVFQAGDAVYMRNWPYAWSLAQSPRSPIAGKVGVATLPRTDAGPHAAALGGESLAVSKYSRHPAEAAALVAWLTGAAVQKQRAIAASFNPSLVALYQDPDVLKANPFMGELAGVFQHAVARPTAATGTHYVQVSSELCDDVHDVLSGRMTAEAATRALAASLVRVSRGGRWH